MIIFSFLGFFACLISIGLIFALPLALSFVKNLNNTGRQLVLISLSLPAYAASFLLLSYGAVGASQSMAVDRCFAREEPCSVYFPDEPEKDTMLNTELWLQNLLPPFMRPNLCFSGDAELCNAAMAEHLRLGNFNEMTLYFIQIFFATISLLAYMGFAWRFTRLKPKAKKGGEITP